MAPSLFTNRVISEWFFSAPPRIGCVHVCCKTCNWNSLKGGDAALNGESRNAEYIGDLNAELSKSERPNDQLGLLAILTKTIAVGLLFANIYGKCLSVLVAILSTTVLY